MSLDKLLDENVSLPEDYNVIEKTYKNLCIVHTMIKSMKIVKIKILDIIDANTKINIYSQFRVNTRGQTLILIDLLMHKNNIKLFNKYNNHLLEQNYKLDYIFNHLTFIYNIIDKIFEYINDNQEIINDQSNSIYIVYQI